MPTELPKQYDPKEAQEKWLRFWNERGYFHSDPPATSHQSPATKPYTIVIPPPNVTGALHMGHALNNTLQDVLVRWRRMQGFNTLWMPGTDHAGIATQAVVEKRIFQEEKKTRHDLGRDELVKRIWQWKDQYEKRILSQLQQLGCSCDWRRTRFTLDEQCSRAVRQTFFDFFKQGLIYRGKRLVNWDTQLQTSVADDETYTEDTKSGFWTFKYAVQEPHPPTPLSAAERGAGGERLDYIRFSTTRPETMLGDTAVCLHPNDDRYKHLIGKEVLQPLTGRSIPIIADGQLADPTLGTGCVKVTPAHDPNDYACYQRNPQIGIINILNPDGTINENGGRFKGLDRYKAREEVTKAMEELGLFEGKEERIIPLKFSDRSKTPVEPYLSDQWFVRMGDGEPGALATGASLPPLSPPGGEGPGVRGSTRQPTPTPSPLTPLPQGGEGDKKSSPLAPPGGEGSGVRGSKGLAQLAMDAVTSGRVKIHPERYAKTYLDWLGEKRDWCISRQLWWGHRIPVWRLTFGFESDDPGDCTWNEDDVLFLLTQWISETGLKNEIVTHHDSLNSILLCARTQEADRKLAELASLLEPYDREKAKDYGKRYPNAPPLLEMICSLIQDPDVLDTWFSSALWPFATLGWPEQTPELNYYYPTDVLVTSRGIITLWVARMVIAGLMERKEVPFRDVYITTTILDGFGETMSKSKGNGVDPLDIIERYGTDALRFQIAYLSTDTQDNKLPVSNVCPHCDTLIPVKQEHMYMRTRKVNCPNCKQPFRPGGPWPSDDPELKTAKQASESFEQGRNFANKLWNVARFVMMNLEGYAAGPIEPAQCSEIDAWILHELAETRERVTQHLENFRFSDTIRTLYDFVWSDYCDWYVEMAKVQLKDADARPRTQRVLVGVLDEVLRLLHPIMPFVTESLWQALNEAAPFRGEPEANAPAESVMIAPWPTALASASGSGVAGSVVRLKELVKAVRNLRNEFRVNEKDTVDVSVRCSAAVAQRLKPLAGFILPLAKVGKFVCGPDVVRPPQSATAVQPDLEAYVHLQGLIDVPAEIKRMQKQRGEKERQLQGVRAKLANASFVDKAPPEVVQQQKQLETELVQQMKAIDENLTQLGKG